MSFSNLKAKDYVIGLIVAMMCVGIFYTGYLFGKEIVNKERLQEKQELLIEEQRAADSVYLNKTTERQKIFLPS